MRGSTQHKYFLEPWQYKNWFGLIWNCCAFSLAYVFGERKHESHFFESIESFFYCLGSNIYCKIIIFFSKGYFLLVDNFFSKQKCFSLSVTFRKQWNALFLFLVMVGYFRKSIDKNFIYLLKISWRSHWAFPVHSDPLTSKHGGAFFKRLLAPFPVLFLLFPVFLFFANFFFEFACFTNGRNLK